MKTLESKKYSNELISWLASQPTSFHLTLSFHANTNHTETLKLLNSFMKHLNRRVYKKRYSNQLSFIQGIVIREKTTDLQTDHYHLLLTDKDMTLPDYERLNALVSKSVRSLKGRSGRNQNHIKSFYLQKYTNEDHANRLESYLLKTIINGAYIRPEYFDCIGGLDPHKVTFGRNFHHDSY